MGASVDFLSVHEAGRKDDGGTWKTDARDFPVARLLVVNPSLFPDLAAIDFCDFSEIYLTLFLADLAKLVRAFPSADTLFFPFGSYFKNYRQMPVCCLTCTNYKEDVVALVKHGNPKDILF